VILLKEFDQARRLWSNGFLYRIAAAIHHLAQGRGPENEYIADPRAEPQR
jgi:hypothetical protein